MIAVSLDHVGKRYASGNYVIRDLSLKIDSGSSLAITGNNGSGKSTLLQIIAGLIAPSTGSMDYVLDGNAISKEQAIRQTSFSAPYLELIEEFSVSEFLDFHFRFRNLTNFGSIEELLRHVYLDNHRNKQIKSLSSGMRQRLKLGIGLYSEAGLLLLDEPTTNLDSRGISWYQEQIEVIKDTRTILVASNQVHEYAFCEQTIEMASDL